MSVIITQREREALKRAYELELRGRTRWRWHEIQYHPARIMSLIIKDLIEIERKSLRGHWYRLTELGRAIGKAEYERSTRR